MNVSAGSAVAAGAANFLIVGFDRRRHVGVKDEADVRLVDPHAEGDGRADNAIVLAQEGVLIVAAHGMIEPGVVGQRTPAGAGEFRGELFRPASGGAVDDARFAAVGVDLVDELAGGVRFRPHRQKEVRAIERAHEDLGRADKQPVGDFGSGGASAVAVTPIVWTPWRASATSRRRKYSGRKSWPHCETQCASSMARRSIGTLLIAATMSSRNSRSGAI